MTAEPLHNQPATPAGNPSWYALTYGPHTDRLATTWQQPDVDGTLTFTVPPGPAAVGILTEHTPHGPGSRTSATAWLQQPAPGGHTITVDPRHLIWQPVGPATPAKPATGGGFSGAATCLAAIAIFIFPPLFGIAAIITAAIGLARGERKASAAMAFAIIALITGIAWGAYVGAHTYIPY